MEGYDSPIMRRSNSFLTLDDVTVHNAGGERVAHLNWRVKRGEHWAVVGPNGAGKSSLAEAIAGRAHFTGEIEYGFGARDGDPCERIAAVSFLLHKQFAGQSDGYFQSRWYPGEEEATLTAREILGEGKAVDAVVKLMGISELMERQALHLSTGEMRRLLIARALLLKPVILILDEPLIGLDVECRAMLHSALERVMRNKRGPTVILLTTRPHDLPKGISRVLFLRGKKALGEARVKSKQARMLEARAFRGARNGIVPIGKARGSKKSIVDLRDVGIVAGEQAILKGVNWHVRAGECWAVLGPNGAGKTTLLSLLTGDHPQSFAQHVALFGKLRSEHATRELKAQIGHASPDIALHYDGHTRTLDFVCTGFFETLGLYNHASKRQERIAWEWLRYFGLEDFASHPFRLLSDGQQRLVLLARALVKNPRLLILDEPCQGLDERNREAVRRALNAAAERGVTLIVVSHYVDELPRRVTHRMELRKGEEPEIYGPPQSESTGS